MKSRLLHLSLALALSACTASAPKSAPQGHSQAASTSIDPNQTVAEMDGQPIKYSEVDKEVGPKVRQAEVEYLTKVHDLRRGALDEMINKRLLEGEAKKAGKPLDQWLQTDFFGSIPQPTDEQVKAFYEEHKAQLGGASYEDAKGRLGEFVKREQAQKKGQELLESLRKQHGVKEMLPAPELPRIEVAATGPAKGPGNAKVTMVVFSDFQCPYCSRVEPTLAKVMKDYDGKVKMVFRQFPLDFHPMAAKAAEASLCAADQGKFWEMHDKMFSDQNKLGVPDLKQTARGLGLDGDKFDKCLDSGEKKATVDADLKAGQEAGVQGTPAFFVNGVFINGAVPYEQFKEAIDRELNKG